MFLLVVLLPGWQICRSVGETEMTRNQKAMESQKCHSYELWCREIEQKQQHINGTENILLNDCTAKDVLNYDQYQSYDQYILDCATTWNPYILEDS